MKKKTKLKDKTNEQLKFYLTPKRYCKNIINKFIQYYIALITRYIAYIETFFHTR